MGIKTSQQPVQPVTQQRPQPVRQPAAQYIQPEPVIEGFDDLEQENTTQPIQQEVAQPVMQQVVQPAKRGRGRPRKNPVPTQNETLNQPQPVKRGRGRPRKNPVPVQELQEPLDEDFVLPGLEPQEEPKEAFLPGFNEVEDTPISQTTSVNQTTQEAFLPGFEEEDEEENTILPGLGVQQPQTQYQPVQQYRPEPQLEPRSSMTNSYENNLYGSNSINRARQDTYEEEIDLSNLLTPDKKIVTFVGTSKNGTSFIVNNIAELMSSIGINTAILDTTKNRNSYYIYTKNEEPLREIATHSIEGLAQGMARGISVNKNLTVYTSLPDENDTIAHVDRILETLLKNYSLILIDTDFDTPLGYFKQSQETYLVQSMDILTIQPLTAFLKELKMKNILDERKLRIVLNKAVKIRGIKDEVIIGGMAFYNDPAMSFMTELFDRDRIKYVSIPFEEETYIRYLEGIIECEISLKGYSKMFIQTLRELGNMIYPIVTTSSRNNQTYQPPSVQTNGGGNFSSSMNNTLDRMKRGY